MSVPSPRAVAPLCLIVLVCSLISGGEDDPVILTGLINQSVLMSLPGDPSRPVLLASWNYKTNQMATYTNHQLIVYDHKFEGRLEIPDDGRTLRIRQLRLEDSGLYTGAITFTDKTNDRKLYNLTVYEPVPTPSLKIVENVTDPDGWCNATLSCSVSNNNSSLSYNWLDGKSGSNFHLYDKNTTIRMARKDYYQSIEFTCIVYNPADMKNASEMVSCLDDKGRGHGHYGLLALMILLLIPLAGLGYYLIKKRKRRKEEPSPVIQNMNREPQYIQVTTFPPNDDKQVWNNEMYDYSPRQNPKAVTLYAVLEQPKQRDDRNKTRKCAV